MLSIGKVEKCLNSTIIYLILYIFCFCNYITFFMCKILYILLYIFEIKRYKYFIQAFIYY